MKFGKKSGPNKSLKTALQYGLWLLGLRDYPEKALREKLINKNYSSEEIFLAIQKLKDYNLVDDLVFAKNWISSRGRFSPRSEYVLSLELLKKGIEREVIKQAFSEITQDDNQEIKSDEDRAVQLIEQVVARKDLSKLDRYAKKQYLLVLLARRGFKYDLARNAIDKFE